MTDFDETQVRRDTSGQFASRPAAESAQASLDHPSASEHGDIRARLAARGWPRGAMESCPESGEAWVGPEEPEDASEPGQMSTVMVPTGRPGRWDVIDRDNLSPDYPVATDLPTDSAVEAFAERAEEMHDLGSRWG